MPRILFAGDPHGEFSQIRAAGRDADAIILLGDQTPNRPLPGELGLLWERTFFLLGNHDTESSGFLVAHMGEAWGHNLHGRVEEVGRLRLAGLGGVFRGRIWHPRQECVRYHSRQELLDASPSRTRFLNGIPALHWSSIFPEDFELIRGLAPVNILVCHEAPESHKYGFQIIGDLARQVGALLVVHGHHHAGSGEAKIEGGIQVIGLGLREIRSMEF